MSEMNCEDNEPWNQSDFYSELNNEIQHTNLKPNDTLEQKNKNNYIYLDSHPYLCATDIHHEVMGQWRDNLPNKPSCWIASPGKVEDRRQSRDEKRRKRRASVKYRTAHASRERLRVEAFNNAFTALRHLLPTLPPDKKLSKIEILRLAICYISYLDHVLGS